MNNKDFFFCYNKRLSKFLKFEKGIDAICHAISPSSKQDYYLFHITDELNTAIEEYKTKYKQQN